MKRIVWIAASLGYANEQFGRTLDELEARLLLIRAVRDVIALVTDIRTPNRVG